MKIAIIDMDNLKNPFWGAGQARATREVGKRLALKHEVTVYSSKYPGYKDYEEDGIKYVHVGLSSKKPRVVNFSFILTIPWLVRKIKADIIIENFNAPTSVSFAPLFTRIPVIGLPTMFNAIEFAKKYHIPFHWIEKLGMKFYKYMLPYSDMGSTKIKKLNPKTKFKIVPLGVGGEFFKIKHSKPEYILFLGRYDIEQKGIDLLIKAYAKVAEKIKYPLLLAGHGPDKAKILDLINKLGLGSKVKEVGSAYGEKKTKLIEKALYTVFPSKHDELSVWALESLASGLPIVAFDLLDSKWISNDVALKAKPFQIDEYATLLLKLTDQKLNENMK